MGFRVIEGPVLLYDNNSNPLAVEQGTAVPADQGILQVGGKDASGDARPIRQATDGTVRVDPSGTTTQPVSAASLPLPTGAATETTLATRATESTLATRATEATLATRATETTLAAADTKLGTIDAVLDSIKDTDGVKKITDALPVGDNLIGRVKLSDGTEVADITPDAGVNRLEILGKVSVVGALPPPSTTPVDIFADTPLTVGTDDTTFTVPDGETFHLQAVTAGNEDPTKGAVIEVIFDDGSEHIIERLYTNGETIQISFPDVETARDGTALLGDSGGTSDIIVRRTKYTGTNIAIDAIVTGYTV